MNCEININVQSYPTLNYIKNRVGNDKKFVEILNLIAVNKGKDIIPTDDFINWCKEKESFIDISFHDNDKAYKQHIFDLIQEYYKLHKPNISNFNNTDKTDVIALFGYENVDARNIGISSIIGGLCRNEFENLLNDKHKLVKFKLVAIDRIINSKLSKEDKIKNKGLIKNAKNIRDVIDILQNNNLSTKVSFKGNTAYYKQIATLYVKKHFMENVSKWYTKAKLKDLSSKEVETIINDYIETFKEDPKYRNIIALYKEITNPQYSNALFEEIINNNKLSFIKQQLKDEFKEDENAKILNEETKDDTDDNISDNTNTHNDYDSDITIKLTEHFGEYTSAMYHINDFIKIYLNSLEQTNLGSADLNNPVLMPLTLDGEEIINLLYHYTDKSTVDNFINSIERLASIYPKYNGLNKLAEDMKSNDNIKYSIYTTFSKISINKIVVQNFGTSSKAVISNNRNTRKNVLIVELLNSYRSNLLFLNYSNIYTKKIENIIKGIGYLKNENAVNEQIPSIIENDIIPIIKDFFGDNISAEDLMYYVNNKKYKINPNSEPFVDIKKSTLTILDKLNNIINNTESVINKISDLRKGTTLFSKDFLNETIKTNITQFADMLSDYVIVKCELNSINPHGNQSSNIINSSLITNYKQIFEDEERLQKFKEFAQQSQQYKYSPILNTQVDDNGKVLNKGLFTETGVNTGLIDIELYDGAKNYDTDEGITYAEHTDDAYITSMFSLFFNSSDNSGNPVTKFMMRTPSDSPKNFIVSMPSIDTNTFYRIDTTFINAIINKINNIQPIEKSSIHSDYFHTIKDVEIYIKHLINSENIKIKLNHFDTSNFDYNKSIIITCNYNGTEYFVQGKINSNKIFNGKIIGVANDSKLITEDENINAELNYALFKDNYKEIVKNITIFKNSNMYKLMKNIFKQEVLNAAVALDMFFETDDTGLVKRASDGTDEVLWKTNEKEGNKIKGCYENYHYKGKYVLEKDDLGEDHLTGNVFSSDRFIVKGKNYGKKILESKDEKGNRIFDFLYGGANNNYIHTIKTNGEVTDVTFTDKQNEVIDRILEEYIIELIGDSFERLYSEDNNPTLKMLLTPENIINFITNYQLAYTGFNDLFEGDSKFYRSAVDFFKRAKESQGAGTSYGIINFMDTLNNSVKFLKDIEIDNNNSIKLYNKFKAVTVETTKMSNEYSRNVVSKKLQEHGMPKEEADKLMEGFGNTKANDAQSYITLDEFVRRIYTKGQYYKYEPLIKKLYNNEPLNAKELTSFIQVQKNFYYSQHFDEVSKIHVPVQIKNAEFVLIPQLIKGTQLEVIYDLMTLHGIDQLNTSEASKAGKANTLTLFNPKQNKLNDDVEKEYNIRKANRKVETITSLKDLKETITERNEKIKQLTNIKEEDKSEFSKAIESGKGISYYSYDFLYTQQETPQHMDEVNKAGIQLIKKLLDNITENNGDLWEAKQTFIECYCNNIKDSAKSLFTDLELELGENGNINVTIDETTGIYKISGLNYKIFYDKLKKELQRLGVDSNTLDYATLREDDNSIAIMPNFLTMIGNKLENVAQSVFNNTITRQTLPGFHAAQITDIGFTTFGTKQDDNITYDKELKYHTDDKGNYTHYVEIKLPRSAFNFDLYQRDINGNYKLDELGKRIKKTDRMLLDELRANDQKLDEIIGYRIPTEGKQSIAIMKVVGFIDESYGSTIVVPPEWVAQTGSDFDIDSIYGIQFNTSIDKNGCIIQSKNNERHVNTNQMIESMLNILSHPKTLEENMSRSNFDDIIKDRDFINSKLKDDDTKHRSVYNVLDQVLNHRDAMSGRQLKGFSVARDNFTSVCNNVKPNLQPIFEISKDEHKGVPIKIVYNLEDLIKQTKRTKKITKEDKSNYLKILETRYGKDLNKLDENHIEVTFTKFGWSNDNKNIVNKFITVYSSETTAHILDAIKEGFIRNVNDYTFGIYKLFPDLGIDYRTAIVFMSQKGVTRIVKNNNSNGSVFNTSFKNPIVESLRQIAYELNLNIDEYDNLNSILGAFNNHFDFNNSEDKFSLNNINNVTFNQEELINNLNNSSPIYEIKTILQFYKLKQIADNIGEIASVCNPDKFGAKQTIFKTNEVFEKINDILNKPSNILFKTFLDNGNVVHILQAIYPNVDLGLADYINSDNEGSKYPILNTFLKYATAPSIIVNRHLFKTQTPYFMDFIKGLERRLSNNFKLNESQYKHFEQYVIGELYNSVPSLIQPITMRLITNPNRDKSFIFDTNITFDNTLSKNEIESNERDRIYGYSTHNIQYTTDPNASDKENVLKFNIKDIVTGNVSQEDINNFSKLSPAQKIQFIKNKFNISEDTNIFNYLNVNLVNLETFGKKKIGSQTIEFVENSISNEEAYRLMKKAFNNNHPFIKLAIYDLIKYAFIVEGFKMKKRGISKIIPNVLLYGELNNTNNINNNGIGVIDELLREFSNFEKDFDKTYIYERYIRGNYEKVKIPVRKVSKVKNKNGHYVEELQQTTDKVIIVPVENNKNVIEKYKLGYYYTNSEGFEEMKPNSYTRLIFKRKITNEFNQTVGYNNIETLYKINYDVINKQQVIILTPLQKLKENEHTDVSKDPNIEETKYISEYYEKLLNEVRYELQYTIIPENKNIVRFLNETFTGILIENKEDYTINNKNKAKVINSTTKDLDENTEQSLISFLSEELSNANKKVFSEDTIYVFHKGLGTHITKRGSAYGLTTNKIPVKGFINNPNLHIYKVSKGTLNIIQQKLKNNDIKLSEHLIPVYEKLKHLQIETLINEKNEVIFDIYGIKRKNTPKIQTIRTSGIVEGTIVKPINVAYNIFDSIKRDVYSTTPSDIAVNINKEFKSRNIEDKASIEKNLSIVLKAGYEYSTKKVEEINNKLKNFIVNEDNTTISIDNAEAITEISKDPIKHQEFLTILFEAKRLIEHNKNILDLDVYSEEDSSLNYYLNIIKNNIIKLTNNVILEKAWNNYFNIYLKQFSDNPLIKNDTLHVLNGFYSTSAFNTWIGDMQETTNPAIQIITKQVTSDLYTMRQLALKRVREFHSYIDDLKNKAAKEGKTIDWNNIIDEYGRFIQNYNNQFVEDLENHQNKCSELRAEWINEEDSIRKSEKFKKYYIAVHEFNKFKKEWINQELDTEYYNKKWELENSRITNENPSVPLIFFKYKELEMLRGEIYTHINADGTFDDEIQDKLTDINRQIKDLIKVDINYEELNESTNPLKNPVGVNQLTIYIKEIKDLDEEYYEKENKYGFDTQLQIHLATISKYELKDPNGNFVINQFIRQNSKEYKEAKRWIAHNAKRTYEHEEEINKARNILYTNKLNSPLKAIETNKFKLKDITDQYGIIDATQLSEEQIAKIKNTQQTNITFRENTSASDRLLFKAVKPDPIIYNRRFYEGFHSKDRTKTQEWINIISEINNILKDYWNPNTNTIDFISLLEQENGVEICKKLASLYEKLDNVNKYEENNKILNQKIAKFIKENVNTELTEEEQKAFNIAEKQVSNKFGENSKEIKAWRDLNVTINERDGVTPNRYLWSNLRPKDSKKEEYIDKEKTEAINTLNKYFTKQPTNYYYDKLEEMQTKSETEYKKWYNDNHIYNPNTNQYEPIECWMAYYPTKENKLNWKAKWFNQTKSIKEDYKNPDYKPKVGYLANFRTDRIARQYANEKVKSQNKYEIELKNHIRELLTTLIKTEKGRVYIEKGYLPSMHKAKEVNNKTIIDEVLRFVGYKVDQSGYEHYHNDISYSNHKILEDPLTKLLDQITPEMKHLSHPVKEDDETEESYNKRLNEYNDAIKVLEKENKEAHKNALNNNWEEVISTFILQASRVNAIRKNELILYAGQHLLETQPIYDPNYAGQSGFKHIRRQANDKTPNYATTNQKNLLNQYETWLKRVIYDEFKEPSGWLTRWGARLQSLTSAQYMMMNLKGGIANITLGEVQILGERFAREYFDSKTYTKGLKDYNSCIIDVLSNMNNDKSTTVYGALIKAMNILDYSEHKGVSAITQSNTMKGFKMANTLAYSPQIMGEHYLNHVPMFSMFESHRIFEETNSITGKPVIKFKNLHEHILDKELSFLKSFVENNPKYKEEYESFMKNIKEDINTLKDYAWFRKNDITQFALQFIKDENDRKEFIKAKKELIKVAKEEFETKPTVISEMELGKDGYLSFKIDGILDKNDISENNEPSASLKALADFRGRIISVNKKIHGVYDKLGQAQIEKKWFGGALMQFHKHIWPGILKRWRIKGYYNEQRGTIERGSIISLYDFLRTPFKELTDGQNLTKDEKNAIKAVQNTFRKLYNFAINIGFYWNVLPDYEKANIRRNLGDAVGIAVAIVATLALRGMNDDDEYEDSIVYNIALYEADRLLNEASTFHIFGAVNEARTLWSKPIAAQSLAEDLISIMGFATSMLFNENFEPTYQTGRFAGENKILSRLKRRIPIYRGIHTSIYDIVENNNYYKIGNNILTEIFLDDDIEFEED